MSEPTNAPPAPPTITHEDLAKAAALAGVTIGKTVLIHKKDAEGGLTINAYTGEITTPLDERPEWADGLTNALLSERHQFYTSRLGPTAYTDAMKFPEIMAYEDLSWLHVDADGEGEEIEADAEHRMDILAAAIGLEGREVEHFDKMVGAEISMDRERTAEEVSAFEHSQQDLKSSKTGTEG